MSFKTEQEEFWAGAFGNEYVERNQGERMISANVNLFSQILRAAPGVSSAVELGCNIGLNLQALHRINHDIELCGYEINEKAAAIARESRVAEITCGTILAPLIASRKFDLAFTKGVLIHINPEELGKVYENLSNLSNRYIMVCEYYNPSPVTVRYRGNEERLFKRDFAGELIERFKLRLLNYGFLYRRDSSFAQDDMTWFLMEKQ